jgi:hypothetical protein
MADALHGERQSVQLKFTGQAAQVPDDPYIKLCYYLFCVTGTSCPSSIPRQFLDYQSMTPGAYRSTEDLKAILQYAEEYSPSKIESQGCFIRIPGEVKLSGDMCADFLKVTASSSELGLLATNKAALALIRRSSASVTVLMFKPFWETNYYSSPRRAIQSKIYARK